MGKIIVGIAGEIASGKDTVAHYLANQYGARTFMFSDPLRDVLNRIHVAQTRENLTKVSGALRSAFGENLLSHAIAEDAVRDPNPLVVIDGVRRQSDIEAVKGFPEFSLIYVEASMETRYGRIVKRRQNADDDTKTFEDFKRDHSLETEVGIPALKGQARYVIGNEGSLEELYAAVDAAIAEMRKEASDRKRLRDAESGE
ncbi:MAG: AAA family ATPase [Candidatus Moranbacteria bacterium]|nr:AAA family ATPase [Candidatus Moranbacteria bacterium]